MQAEREKVTPFMGRWEDYAATDSVILGVPLDDTVSFRPGSRFAPRKIREVSIGLEEYSPLLDKDLADYRYYDAGDLLLAPGSVEQSLTRIGGAWAEIRSGDKLPILLGGEHLLTFPAVQRAAKLYPDLVVLQFDAHTDLRQEYLGSKLSHASVIRRICQWVAPERIYQMGIRSGTREEFVFARKHTNFAPEMNLEILAAWVAEIKERPVYLTLDIDVLDPAFAPGTGTPEQGGCTSAQLLAAFPILSSLSVVGFDLVEVCPLCDHGDITSILAAKLVREAILAFSRPGENKSE
ncbi:MAG: agmatinase [Clostridia bacterium]|nr:agmatinase [Clostridia bacterium]